MEVIVAGGRDIDDPLIVLDSMINSGFDITELVCGEAKGVDTTARKICECVNIPVKSFPADWAKYHRAAGPIRNKQMAEYADALIAVMKPGSIGTANMVKQAKKMGLPIYGVMIHENGLIDTFQHNK